MKPELKEKDAMICRACGREERASVIPARCKHSSPPHQLGRRYKKCKSARNE
jgi:hypothetical protein